MLLAGEINNIMQPTLISKMALVPYKWARNQHKIFAMDIFLFFYIVKNQNELLVSSLG